MMYPTNKHLSAHSIPHTHTRRTVVLIHMRQATLAPMAMPPANPPRRADCEALAMTSEKDMGSFFLVSVDPDMVGLYPCCWEGFG